MGTEMRGNHAAGRMLQIDTREICAGALQVDAEDSMALLSASIAKHGLLQPLIVREAKGGYALICGARRLEACRRLGIGRVDAVCVDADEQEALVIRLEERHTAHDPPFIQEARQIAARGGMQIARQSVLGGAFFERRLRALALGERVVGVAERERLSPEQCEPLFAIADPALREEAAEIIAQRRLTPEQAWRLVCGRARGDSAAGWRQRTLETDKVRGERTSVQSAGRKRRRRIEMHTGENPRQQP